MSKKIVKKYKKETHGQSAMEYLMTYGWSILIIAIALVSLFELGYFNTSNISRSACLSQVGFLCTNPILNSTGNLTLTVGNNQGGNLVVTGLGCSNSSAAPTVYSPILLTLGEGQEKNVTFMCQLQSQSLGSSFKGSLWLKLNNGQQEELGSTSATVSTGSPTGSSGSNGQGTIYLSNSESESNNVIQLNLANGNIINSISLGETPLDGPISVAFYDQDLYITNQYGGQYGSGNIIIYNTQTNQFSSIDSPLFDRPQGIAFSGANAYITNLYGGLLQTGNIITLNIFDNIITGSPRFTNNNMLYNPSSIILNGSLGYLMGEQYGQYALFTFNPFNNEVNKISSYINYLGSTPSLSIYNNNLYMVYSYTPDLLSGNLLIYNTQTNQFSSIDSPLFDDPQGIAFSGANAYITNPNGGQYNSGNLLIYNTQTNQFSSIDSSLFDNPEYITKSGSDLYIYNSGNSNILVYNPSQDAIVNTITSVSHGYSITGMSNT
ncbi:MAG: hypothetical protein ACP5M9_02260 [Candidatus Micrarchaeia archaeon]